MIGWMDWIDGDGCLVDYWRMSIYLANLGEMSRSSTRVEGIGITWREMNCGFQERCHMAFCYSSRYEVKLSGRKI